MMPIDIVKVLTAAAPIVASVASIATSEREPEIIHKTETPSNTNNISINITNNFYSTPPQDMKNIASQLPDQILDAICAGPRYEL